MNYIVDLPSGREIKLYYNDKVYSPEYSSIDTVVIADRLAMVEPVHILDIACGSGIIGLSLKKLNPLCTVTLTDIDPEAVRISRLNAKRIGLDVSVYEADLLPKLGSWHMITANLPTYDQEQMETESLHGPMTSYYPGEDPLKLYKRLFKEAKGRCAVLVAECQKKHQAEFKKLAIDNGWKEILATDYSFAFMEDAPILLG